MSCTGNPSNCSFCGNTPASADCAKNEVSGCTTNPGQCQVCEGKGCVAVECTGNTSTCKACQNGHFQTCRKIQLSQAEGVEPARSAAPQA